MRLRNELLPLFLLALETSPLMGVGTTGTIVGMVTDTLGALVANAKVTVLTRERGGPGSFYQRWRRICRTATAPCGLSGDGGGCRLPELYRRGH